MPIVVIVVAATNNAIIPTLASIACPSILLRISNMVYI
jgi:hypothetical protein